MKSQNRVSTIDKTHQLILHILAVTILGFLLYYIIQVSSGHFINFTAVCYQLVTLILVSLYSLATLDYTTVLSLES